MSREFFVKVTCDECAKVNADTSTLLLGLDCSTEGRPTPKTGDLYAATFNAIGEAGWMRVPDDDLGGHYDICPRHIKIRQLKLLEAELASTYDTAADLRRQIEQLRDDLGIHLA